MEAERRIRMGAKRSQPGGLFLVQSSLYRGTRCLHGIPYSAAKGRASLSWGPRSHHGPRPCLSYARNTHLLSEYPFNTKKSKLPQVSTGDSQVVGSLLEQSWDFPGLRSVWLRDQGSLGRRPWRGTIQLSEADFPSQPLWKEKRKTENNKCWWKCERIGTPGHWWWECQMV